MKGMFRYFFPRIPLFRRLPLPPRGYSSTQSRWGEPPDDLRPALRVLIGAGVARTEADAYRLYRRHPGQSLTQIIRAHKRTRRREPLRARLWRKLKELWR